MPRHNTVRGNHLCHSLYIQRFVEFEGAYFVPDGPYKNSIIKFLLTLPGKYPDEKPVVKIISRFFHPLLDPGTKYLNLPESQAGPHNLISTSIGISKCFEEMFLYGLEESQCSDKQSINLLKTDRLHFDELLAECIRESIEFAKNCTVGMICLGASQPVVDNSNLEKFLNKAI